MRPVLFMVVALIVGCGGGASGKPEPVAAPVGPVVSASPEPMPAESGVTLPEITNSVGMQLKRIPAGEFLMGSPETEADRYDDEKQHRVRITKPFYLGVYEVTQAEYERVMGRNPSGFKGARLPVEMVSWDEAVAFFGGCRSFLRSRKPVLFIGYRRKRSGNMVAVREQRRRIQMATIRDSWKGSATSARTGEERNSLTG